MQEHFTQQEIDSSPTAQKNAAEKPSGRRNFDGECIYSSQLEDSSMGPNTTDANLSISWSLNMTSDGTANQAFKSSPASDVTTLEHELNAATKDSASVDKDSDCQRNTIKSAKKMLADKERSKKKRAMKKLENKGVCMESIRKAGDKDVDGDNADGICTLEELLEEGDGLLEDLLNLKTQDRRTLSIHSVMPPALMEEEAARGEEKHKDWTIRRVSFLARC
ncbi:hypothetical protein K4K58_007724 [Colletotrichum sp. SAR11_239]|nr:hypothetical protein K4K58_007724 [Colletotrichum sp. SAR11_239]